MFRKAFVRELAVVKVKENDRIYFPKWLSRYAEFQDCVADEVPITEAKVIRFCQNLLASGTPAWQRVQAVRAIECYRDLVQKKSVWTGPINAFLAFWGFAESTATRVSLPYFRSIVDFQTVSREHNSF